MDPHSYQVDVTWDKDRQGIMCSPELEPYTLENTCIKVATPPEFPHGVKGIWSPEHLFTAAVSSCFMTTFLSIAENFKLRFKKFRCNAKGKLEQVEGRLMMTQISLEPHLTIEDADQLELANKVLSKTHAACLISNSIRSTVTMKPLVTFTSDEREQLAV